MIVAVVAVWMMQVAIDEIVDVVAVWHGLMAAIGTMLVAGGVRSAVVLRGAIGRILARDGDDVLVVVSGVGMVQMPVMQVIGMPLMADGGVPAVGPVIVLVALVNVVFGHGKYSSLNFAGRFAGMSERIENQVDDVLIGQRIDNVFALPPPTDQ